MGNSRVLGLVVLSVALASACAKNTQPVEPTPTPTPMPTPTPGPNVNPDPQPDPPPPAPLSYSGIYQANAPVDFTQNDTLPGLDSPALGVLATLHTTPGTALVNLGWAAGIGPLDDIGSSGRSLLGSILDGALTDLYKNNPTLDRATTIIQNIAQIAKTSVLQNKLTVHTPNTDHTAACELEMTGCQFSFVDVNLVSQTFVASVPAASAAAAKTSFATCSVTPRSNPNVADADLAFDVGAVSIPMGDFLMQAIGKLVFEPLYGVSDFKTGFVKLFPCDSIAMQAAAAVQGTVFESVFTESLFKTICETGAGALADQLIDQINNLKYDNVQISAGRGVLYDASASKPTPDRVSDRVGDGSWTWSFNSTDVPSSFAGDRIGTAL